MLHWVMSCSISIYFIIHIKKLRKLNKNVVFKQYYSIRIVLSKWHLFFKYNSLANKTFYKLHCMHAPLSIPTFCTIYNHNIRRYDQSVMITLKSLIMWHYYIYWLENGLENFFIYIIIRYQKFKMPTHAISHKEAILQQAFVINHKCNLQDPTIYIYVLHFLVWHGFILYH